MNQKQFNSFCASLLATSHVVQWGGSDVWKVGGKVFAVGGWSDDNGVFAVTFKTTDIAFEMLQEQPGCRPAPYLASRGMKWIQHFAKPGLTSKELKEYLGLSHQMIAAALPKKKQTELGLI